MKTRDLIVAIAFGSIMYHAAYAADNVPAASTDAKTQAGTAPTEGEVRKVDKDAKKITIKHGPIRNLQMPAMTMVFQLANPAMIDQVKPGDKIKFSVEKSGGAMVVTHIEVDK